MAKDYLKEISKSRSDTGKTSIYLDWGKKLFATNPDSSLLIWEKGLSICNENLKSNNNDKYYLTKKSLFLRRIGAYYHKKENFTKALQYLNSSYEICIKQNDIENQSACLKNLGLLYENLIDPNCKKTKTNDCVLQSQNKASNYYLKGKNLNLKQNNKKEVASFNKLIAYIKINLNQLDSAVYYFNESILIQNNLKLYEDLLSTYNDLIYVYQQMGNADLALKEWKKVIVLQAKLKDEFGMSESYFQIGSLYHDKGNIPTALENYYKSLNIKEKTNDKAGIALIYNTLGILFKTQNELNKSIEFHEKALKIYKEVDEKQGIAYTLNNIGNVFDEYGDLNCKSNKKDCIIKGQLIALDYYKKSLIILEGIKDTKGIAYSLNNIGSVYSQIGDPNCRPIGSDACIKSGQEIALNYLMKGLKLKEELGDKQGMAYSLNNIGEAYAILGNNKEADKYLKQSLEISKSLGFPENIRNASELLYKVYKKQNNFSKALEMHELYISMRDSINNSNTLKESVKKDFQHQYEKKAAADSIKNQQENVIKNAQIEAQKAKLKQEETMRYALYGGLFLMVLFAGFIFNRFKVTQKQKEIIELQKTEVEKQKKEVEVQHEIAESRRIIAEEQKEVIQHQKHEVEEKQKEITDSITYASRIQRAMLTSNEYITNSLGEYGSEHFIFYQPKDIVSGDFYWALSIAPIPAWDLGTNNVKLPKESTRSNLFYLCTADCTGHGVPGAFMSLLNISFLNENVLEKNILLPHDILTNQRKNIIRALNPTGKENAKDGMDCVLYGIDYNKMLLHIAAANNPLWIIRKMEENEIIDSESKIESFNGYKLIEFKSNKMPVGLSGQEDTPFVGEVTPIFKGDLIYTFTDGYADQFGGPKGKKFMYKPFKQLLLKNCTKPLDDQKIAIEKNINQWMENVDQIDDILVIGVRV